MLEELKDGKIEKLKGSLRGKASQALSGRVENLCAKLVWKYTKSHRKNCHERQKTLQTTKNA